MQVIFEVYGSSAAAAGTFDNVILNIGNAWSPADQNFKAPVTGVYYFSYSGGSSVSNAVWMDIAVNMAYMYCDSEIYLMYSGHDMASRGCLLSLAAGNSVSVCSWMVSDSSLSQSTFRGFLYSPINPADAVAWSVHYSGIVSGFSGPFPFDTVFANTGMAWQAATYTVSIPIAGVYYIEMVLQPSGVVDMQLTLNGATVLSRIYLAYASSYLTRSRSVLIQLSANDELICNCFDSSITGDGATGVSFQGILLVAS
jgi:hypothetical protein